MKLVPHSCRSFGAVVHFHCIVVGVYGEYVGLFSSSTSSFQVVSGLDVFKDKSRCDEGLGFCVLGWVGCSELGKENSGLLWWGQVCWSKYFVVFVFLYVWVKFHVPWLACFFRWFFFLTVGKVVVLWVKSFDFSSIQDTVWKLNEGRRVLNFSFHARTHAQTQRYTHIRTHTRTHTRTYAHTHTHTLHIQHAP